MKTFLKSLADDQNRLFLIGQHTFNFQGTKIFSIDYMTMKKDYQTIIHLN